MEKLNILIVDDENLTRKALIDGVRWQELGIGQIFEAASMRMAQKVLAEQRIDLALIDVEMPEGSGIDLLEWIRDVFGSQLPCAFLTCHASFPYAQAAVRLQCFDYLLKPADYLEVENLVLRMIGKSRQELERKQISEYGRQWINEKSRESRKHEKSARSPEELVDELVVYIRSHLSDKLSLSELAYNVGMTPNYLNKIFKYRTGDTVNKFIINERMKLAATLLEEGRVKSYAIAESLGYDNYANFVNMFKKNYGMSPNEYRERAAAISRCKSNEEGL